MIRLGDVFIGNFPVTQKFGENFKLANGNWAYKTGHMGWDFGTPRGTVIVAPTEGIVLRAGDYKDGYGICVQIWNKTEGFAVKLGHLMQVDVRVGEEVWFGRQLGLADNTGFSTGNHLHVEAVNTDAAGYRLNTSNGYGGCVDLAGKWTRIQNLKAPLPKPVPAPQPQPSTTTTLPPETTTSSSTTTTLPPVKDPFVDKTTPINEPPIHVDNLEVEASKPATDPTNSQAQRITFYLETIISAILNLIKRFRG